MLHSGVTEQAYGIVTFLFCMYVYTHLHALKHQDLEKPSTGSWQLLWHWVITKAKDRRPKPQSLFTIFLLHFSYVFIFGECSVQQRFAPYIFVKLSSLFKSERDSSSENIYISSSFTWPYLVLNLYDFISFKESKNVNGDRLRQALKLTTLIHIHVCCKNTLPSIIPNCFLHLCIITDWFAPNCMMKHLLEEAEGKIICENTFFIFLQIIPKSTFLNSTYSMVVHVLHVPVFFVFSMYDIIVDELTK